MEGIEKIINVVGALLVAGGILIGGFLFINVDRATYKEAQENASRLTADATDLLTAQSTGAIYYSEITFALSILLGGIIVGLFFLGFAKLIDITAERNYATSQRIADLSETVRKLNNA